MCVRDERAETARDVADNWDKEDLALILLVSRALKRGDQMLAWDLCAVPPRSDAEFSEMVQAGCPALARIAAVCDPIETLAWRRALVHASSRGDCRRVRVLLYHAARRCAN